MQAELISPTPLSAVQAVGKPPDAGDLSLSHRKSQTVVSSPCMEFRGLDVGLSQRDDSRRMAQR